MHSPASGVCLHCSFVQPVGRHVVRIKEVNVVKDDAVFQFGLMVVPLIGLWKGGNLCIG